MRISKRTREQAALICQLMASNNNESTDSIASAIGITRACDELERHPAWALALECWDVVWLHYFNRNCAAGSTSAYDAEAESLLRCGRSPGDEL